MNEAKPARVTNFKLVDLTRALIAARRAGTPVREVIMDGGGIVKLTMKTEADEEAAGPPTQGEIDAEKAELDRLVAADKP